jgi:hypothetical protein
LAAQAAEVAAELGGAGAPLALAFKVLALLKIEQMSQNITFSTPNFTKIWFENKPSGNPEGHS